jgi:hypothetical protein
MAAPAMSTFLRVELVARDGQPGNTILVNVDHIVSIHPAWPDGATILTTDNARLNVGASLDELHKQMTATNGRITVKLIGHLLP